MSLCAGPRRRLHILLLLSPQREHVQRPAAGFCHDGGLHSAEHRGGLGFVVRGLDLRQLGGEVGLLYLGRCLDDQPGAALPHPRGRARRRRREEEDAPAPRRVAVAVVRARRRRGARRHRGDQRVEALTAGRSAAAVGAFESLASLLRRAHHDRRHGQGVRGGGFAFSCRPPLGLATAADRDVVLHRRQRLHQRGDGGWKALGASERFSSALRGFLVGSVGLHLMVRLFHSVPLQAGGRALGQPRRLRRLPRPHAHPGRADARRGDRSRDGAREGRGERRVEHDVGGWRLSRLSSRGPHC
mmetsp:Transcript_43867/g.115788  ORF Transcript_43867/g.115788 Transcript_43867/m.115788 type:complete len:300 (+) Transcript_43867:581-1480(+)